MLVLECSELICKYQFKLADWMHRQSVQTLQDKERGVNRELKYLAVR
jgi:hypothetical protein